MAAVLHGPVKDMAERRHRTARGPKGRSIGGGVFFEFWCGVAWRVEVKFQKRGFWDTELTRNHHQCCAREKR